MKFNLKEDNVFYKELWDLLSNMSGRVRIAERAVLDNNKEVLLEQLKMIEVLSRQSLRLVRGERQYPKLEGEK